MTGFLDRMRSPKDIKKLTPGELSALAQDLRAEMIASTSLNGGHLASSLGAVELVLAAHRALDLPHDKLVFDVGHQAYAHKMLTGRLAGFASLRHMGGTSGFTRRLESEYDVHDSGHASDSLAVALGLSIARDLRGGDEKIVTIIGDASIGGGLALEALNTIGQLKKRRFVVILNDNEMSISQTTGAMSAYLASLRTSQRYVQTRDAVEGKLSKTGIGAELVKLGERAKVSAKQLIVQGMLFEEFGFMYLGPIDGHDVATVQETLERALTMDGPVVIHAVTKKGKGYAPAEMNPETFHGVGPFDVTTGIPVPSKSKVPSFTSVFADALVAEASKNKDIVAITAAMPAGTGLSKFGRAFPDRFFDVGIAEECAVTMSSGIAIGGKTPVVAIYSTFLQRAYDEIVTNVCLPNLHVIFAVDRGGLVGQDGSTHHGMLDMAFLRSMPNMKVIAPSDEAELVEALHTALAMEGPVAIRYPRGSGRGVDVPEVPSGLPMCARLKRDDGQAGAHADQDVDDNTKIGSRVCILAVGNMVERAEQVSATLSGRGLSCGVIDMRWVKPIDVNALRTCAGCELVVTLEDGTTMGGFGSAVLEGFADLGLAKNVLRLGIQDEFVGHGTVGELMASLGLSVDDIADSIEQRLAWVRPDPRNAGRA